VRSLHSLFLFLSLLTSTTMARGDYVPFWTTLLLF
jgi:hypothetical protein